MTPALRALTFAALLGSAAPLAAHAQAIAADPTFAATTLNLSADGETQATPDQAVITLGVQTHAGTAAGAMADNARRMSAVIAALRGAGIAAKDIRTSNLSLNAQYDYPQNAAPHLNGYQASNDVTITVEEVERLGPTIDAVTNAGANQVNGISFGLKSARAAEDAARLEAVKALKAKAELYAEATGYHIARLVNLSEGGGEAYQPRPMAMMRAEKVQGVPVSTGELTVRVQVNAVFELAK